MDFGEFQSQVHIGMTDGGFSDPPDEYMSDTQQNLSGPDEDSDMQQDGTEKRRPWFSGAARRRYAWWKSQGKTDEEAAILCRTPYSELVVPEGTLRRQRLQESSSQERPSKAEHQLSSSDVTGSIRVGVKDVNKIMTEDELVLLQNEILNSIDLTDGHGPRFLGCSRRAGWLELSCFDGATLEWLSSWIAAVQPWDGADLCLVDGVDLPKPIIGVAFIPDLKADAKAILHRLKVQNRGIDCRYWRVLNRKLEEKGQTVTFSFDRLSLEALKKTNCRLFFNFGDIQIRVKYPKAGGEAGDGGPTVPVKTALARAPSGPGAGAGTTGIGLSRPETVRARTVGGTAWPSSASLRAGASAVTHRVSRGARRGPRGRTVQTAGVSRGVTRAQAVLVPFHTRQFIRQLAARNPSNN